MGSPLQQGKFQFDLWNHTPSNRYDWELLRTQIKEHGVRNSLLIALMPTASTSNIMGNNECFEPFTSNLYKRKTSAGEFILINKYLVKDLIKLNLWNSNIKDKIILHEGIIQNILEIPENIRNLYKTAWEIKSKPIIEMAADRAPYICQTQSMNLFLDNPNSSSLTKAHFYGWKKGLKTGMYYLRTKTKATTQKFTIDPERLKELESHTTTSITDDKIDCENCGA